MWTTVVIVLHTLIAIGLIITVVMQSPRDAGLSGAIGGAGEQVFGKKKGTDEILARITTVLAILFVLTALLAVFLETRA